MLENGEVRGGSNPRSNPKRTAERMLGDALTGF